MLWWNQGKDGIDGYSEAVYNMVIASFGQKK